MTFYPGDNICYKGITSFPTSLNFEIVTNVTTYMSDLGYIHCDLKPNNILIKNNNILLADFTLLRIKENIFDVPCQTLNYRAPELYYTTNYDVKYSKLFSPLKIEKMTKNQISSEMWSFGIMCLDILYNKPFLTWYGGKGLLDKEYEDLITTLSTDYGKVNSYEIIINRYGKLDTNESEVLKFVCNCFLDLDQDNRIKSYKEFLRSSVFDNINIPELSNFSKIYPESSMVINKENIYNPAMLNIATKWMFEVAEEFELSLYIIFNAVDFFLQRANKYISKREEIQLFAIASLWINSTLHLNNEHRLHEYIYISNYAYSGKEIYTKIMEIIRGEKGKFLIECIYDYLPTVETLYQARDIMCDVEKYSKLGVKGTSLSLLKPSSYDKLNKNTPKILVEFYKSNFNQTYIL